MPIDNQNEKKAETKEEKKLGLDLDSWLERVGVVKIDPEDKRQIKNILLAHLYMKDVQLFSMLDQVRTRWVPSEPIVKEKETEVINGSDVLDF